MKALKPWILAARPKTLFATLAPIIIGLSLSYKITSEINWVIALMTFLSAILLQIGSNYANDASDFIKGVTPTISKQTSQSKIEHDVIIFNIIVH